MTKYVHCVFVKHEGSDRTFLFNVSDPKKIKSGTIVVCNTKYGEVYGTCIGDSFMVSENALDSIVEGVGAYFPLKDVVGIVTEKYTIQKQVNRFDELPF